MTHFLFPSLRDPCRRSGMKKIRPVAYKIKDSFDGMYTTHTSSNQRKSLHGEGEISGKSTHSWGVIGN